MNPADLGTKGRGLLVDLLRRIEVLERTVQQTPSRFLPHAKRGVAHAKIAWRFTTAHNVNRSEGELVKADGSTLDEELIWIGEDSVSVNSTDLYRESVPLVGNTALYEVELIARDHDRAGLGERDQYRVVRRVSGGVQPLAAIIDQPTDADPSLWLGKLCSDAGGTTVIQTTLAGVAKDNHALVLDAFAETLATDAPVLLLGLIQGDLWLTERRLERLLGLPGGLEDGLDAVAVGDIAVVRVVDGRNRWVPEPKPTDGALPDADPLEFLRMNAAGDAIEGQPMGDVDYDPVSDTIVTDATNLAIGPDGGLGRIYVANTSFVGWIYEGNLSLATNKQATMGPAAGKVEYKDNGVLVIEWSCHATNPALRLYDFKLPVVHSSTVLHNGATTFAADATLNAAQQFIIELTGLVAWKRSDSPLRLMTAEASSGGVSFDDNGTQVMFWTGSDTADDRELALSMHFVVDQAHRTELLGEVRICNDDQDLGFFQKAPVPQQVVPLPDVPTSSGEDPFGSDTVDLIVIQHMLDDIDAMHAQIAEIVDKLGQGSLSSGQGHGLFKHS